jgi:hypothetical protein
VRILPKHKTVAFGIDDRDSEPTQHYPCDFTPKILRTGVIRDLIGRDEAVSPPRITKYQKSLKNSWISLLPRKS